MPKPLSFNTKHIFIFYALAVLMASCTKKNSPAVLRKILSENDSCQAVYLAKLAKHLPVKIACEGTSLTYGQNDPGVMPPINGASQMRAQYQYPQSLQEVLKTNGINVNVINRGYPGDRTTEGILRWKDSTTNDVVILEYGSNDCFNFGGYPNNLSVMDFTTNLTTLVIRRLSQGAWVIIISPPDINPVNAALDPYKAAILSIANKYDLPLFDVEKSVIKTPADYFDGVHLTATAYQQWGVKIAAMLQNQ